MLMRGNALVLKTPVENAPRTSVEKHLSWSSDTPPAARLPLHRSRPAEYQPKPTNPPPSARTTASAQPLTQGEQAQGVPAQGEHVQRETASTWIDMSVRYSEAFRKAAGILKHPVAPHDQWHIDWAIMGQQTFRMNCEAYSRVVLDVGSSLGAVINTRTREDPWQHLNALVAFWGHTPKAIEVTAQLNSSMLLDSKPGVDDMVLYSTQLNLTDTPCKGTTRVS
jgi:hypothetical protein